MLGFGKKKREAASYDDAREEDERQKDEKSMQSLRESFESAVAKTDVLDKILALEHVNSFLKGTRAWTLEKKFGEEIGQLRNQVKEEQIKVIEENYDVLVQPTVYKALFSHFPKDSERNSKYFERNCYGEGLHLVFNDAFIRKSLAQAKEDPSVNVPHPPFFQPQ